MRHAANEMLITSS